VHVLIRIDPLASEPIFEQITYQVKAQVARGELVHGDRLPSVRELAKRVGVNPNTVVKAYDGLERDGVIVRKQGAGCFVTQGETALRDAERERQLGELTERMVTDAFHLGFSPAEVRAELTRALAKMRFPRKRRSN